MPIDHVLKLYSKSIRSPYLHYGFWDHPEEIDPQELTLNDMVKAQDRYICLLYTSPSPRDATLSRMPSSA